MVQLDGDQVIALLSEVFPQVAADFKIDSVDDHEAVVRLMVADRHLRPGGTVSGPSMFALADFAAYAIILANIGPQVLSVTTNANIDFMRKPAADVDMLAKCRLLKLGRSLAVVDMLLFSEGQDDAVARASMTYAIPPKKMG